MVTITHAGTHIHMNRHTQMGCRVTAVGVRKESRSDYGAFQLLGPPALLGAEQAHIGNSYRGIGEAEGGLMEG